MISSRIATMRPSGLARTPSDHRMPRTSIRTTLTMGEKTTIRMRMIGATRAATGSG